jgi:peptide/nickel transport system permease protein
MTQLVSSVHSEPLWKIRLRNSWKALKKNWVLFAENKIGLVGLSIILLFGLMALLHPVLMNTVWDKKIYDPVIGLDPTLVGQNPSPPSEKHLLGTDPNGRDVLSQLMYSTRSEFVLGLLSALITVFIATSIGAIAAYYGGWIDVLFMRLADLISILPFIALLVVLSSFFNLNMWSLALIIGLLTGFGGTTIIFKAQALTIKVKPYIEAAKVAGGNDWHIIFSHIVPNLMPLAFLEMMFVVTGAIFTEAVLSFFGLLNLRMSWGIMIDIARSEHYIMDLRYWYLVIPPSLAITLLCSAFYLVGRALDEVVNPRLRKR